MAQPQRYGTRAPNGADWTTPSGTGRSERGEKNWWRRQGQPAQRRVAAGGGGGIRTHGTLAGTAVFKTAALNHSATPPGFAVTPGQESKFTSSVIFNRSLRCWRSSSIVRFSGTVPSFTRPSVARRSVGAPRSGSELRMPSGSGISIDIIGPSFGSLREERADVEPRTEMPDDGGGGAGIGGGVAK